MGVSVYIIVNRSPDKKVKSGIILFGVQLTLNLLWSIIFFGLKNIPSAFMEILVLWFFIVATIIKFWEIDKSFLFVDIILG
jgi:tryptophan-rich sensory protein